MTSIASGLKRAFDASVCTIDDKVSNLEELRRTFLCSFLSDFGSHDTPFFASDCESNRRQDTDFSISGSLRSVLDSSSRALESLKGLEVRVEELYKLWTERADSTRFRLSQIDWFRERVGAHHEYLLIHIHNDKDEIEDTQGLWLRLERRPTATVERRRHCLTRLFGHFEADDLATISRQKGHLLHRDNMEAELRGAVMFDPNETRLSLRYILEVLTIIHEESPEYHIAGANCWFFASTIVEALLRKVGRQPSLLDHRNTKDYVNATQYTQIMDRIKKLQNPEW
ncbi:hypothetical protein BDV93DRAFT_307205 [Ceratobasidium sp. AG-I]|nr:hypothetical protein BDV93DRAFT_307205 [Ceratobasidium sp. AG-I]